MGPCIEPAAYAGCAFCEEHLKRALEEAKKDDRQLATEEFDAVVSLILNQLPDSARGWDPLLERPKSIQELEGSLDLPPRLESPIEAERARRAIAWLLLLLVEKRKREIATPVVPRAP